MTKEEELSSLQKITSERNHLLEAPKEENEFKVHFWSEKVISEGKCSLEKMKEEVVPHYRSGIHACPERPITEKSSCLEAEEEEESQVKVALRCL